ncbi:MAG: LPS export ABC transporter permease LptG [gamma proteobacterium symbiont of Taylorina sp.]|nr:LPS export ABC transporter permease LptG [gamma proteobacterium symbiont of Taylorina sp.]
MNILDRYIIKTVLISTLLFLLIIMSLYGFIALSDAFKSIGKNAFTTSDAFYYTLLTMPRRIYELYPFSVLLGTMMGLGALNSNSELVVIRAAGVSIAQIILSIMKGAFILALVMFLWGEYIVPVTENAAENHYLKKVHGATSIRTKNAIWVRDKSHFTKISAITPNKELINVSIFTFNTDKTLKVSTLAKKADYNGKNWILHDVKQTFITKDKLIVNKIDKARWPTLLNLELVEAIISKLQFLPASGLYHYASYLDNNGLDSKQYWMAFWNKIIAPFSIVAMLLFAVPFMFDSSRTNNIGNRLMMGVFIGVTFTIANQITAQLGLVYHISPLISATLVTLLTFIAAFFLIRRIN